MVNNRARSFLRALAHGLNPLVQVGVDGIGEPLLKAVSTALDDHELIKVKLGSGFVGERLAAADRLAEATDAHLVQLIGRVVVLYRPRAKGDARNKGRPRIVLPG